MAVVMQLWGRPDGNRTPFDGQYLKSFDFEADNGRGELETTPYLAQAKQFPSMTEAFEFYKTVPRCRPLRANLIPNRPLMATNWEFITI